jgi:TonB family protein
MRRFAFLFAVCVAVLAANPASATDTVGDTGTKFGTPCPYPDAARATRARGVTFVLYLGTEDGAIVDVQILQSSGNSDLDNATVQCLSHWHFDPGADRSNIGKHRLSIMWNYSEKPDESSGIPIGKPQGCANYYPRAEALAGITGRTVVKFMVTETGEVQDPVVETSSGDSHLDEAALRCVATWRYRPAVKDGKPVAVPLTATIKFGEPL